MSAEWLARAATKFGADSYHRQFCGKLATLQRRPVSHALCVPFADEGRMKGLAFAYDPSGYWIELVKRNKEAGFPEKFNLGQTMLRVKDADKSLAFYAGMGMAKAST